MIRRSALRRWPSLQGAITELAVAEDAEQRLATSVSTGELLCFAKAFVAEELSPIQSGLVAYDDVLASAGPFCLRNWLSERARRDEIGTEIARQIATQHRVQKSGILKASRCEGIVRPVRIKANEFCHETDKYQDDPTIAELVRRQLG